MFPKISNTGKEGGVGKLAGESGLKSTLWGGLICL